jgi:exopolyphosphatase/pppGpp-phosphohydrolase
LENKNKKQKNKKTKKQKNKKTKKQKTKIHSVCWVANIVGEVRTHIYERRFLSLAGFLQVVTLQCRLNLALASPF